MFRLIGFLLIGLAAGWLAGRITKGRGFGLLGDLLVGVAGSIVGGILFGILGLTSSNAIGSLITSTAGAVVCLGLLRWLKTKRG